MGLNIGIRQWCLIWVLRPWSRWKGRLRFLSVTSLPGRRREVWLLALAAVRAIVLLGRRCVSRSNRRRRTRSMARRRTRWRRRVVVLLVVLIASGIPLRSAHDSRSMR